MGKISDYIDFSQDTSTIISSLKEKAILVPDWGTLSKDYNPGKHAILSDTTNLRDKHRKTEQMKSHAGFLLEWKNCS